MNGLVTVPSRAYTPDVAATRSLGASLLPDGAGILVFVIAALVYANALWNGFALDDVAIIQQNARVHDFLAWRDIWLTPYWPYFGNELGLYRPLAIQAYALQWAIADGAPWVFHLVNLILHGLVSLLVYRLAVHLLPSLGGRRVGVSRNSTHLAAMLAGLVFAVHPVHTEAVANIVGQAELIAAVATLGACSLYASRRSDSLSVGRLLAIALLFATGMFAKESAIVLPALLFSIDCAQGRLRPLHSRGVSCMSKTLLPFVVLAAVAVLYLLVRIDVLGTIGGVHAAPNLPFLREEHRIFVAFRAWPEYVRLLTWPADLSSDYSPAVILPVEGLSPMAALGALLLAATMALALLTPAFPRAGLPAAWFLVSILPVSNLLMPIGVVVAERLLYSPSVALSLTVAFAARRWVDRSQLNRRIAIVTAAIVFTGAGLHVVRRNPDWKDTSAVWDALVRDHPESYRAQLTNAARATERGQHLLAKEYSELAYRLWKYDAPMLHLLAQYAQRDGHFERAIELLQEAEAVAPFINAYPVALAVAYLAAEEPANALPALDRAAALRTDAKLVLALRAQTYERLGRFGEAAGAWRAALDAPGHNLWSYRVMLARTLARAHAPLAAAATADTAYVRAGSDEERALAAAVKDAIGRRCYDLDASGDSRGYASTAPSCDPLAAWGLIVPTARPNATTLQNASASGGSAPADEGGE